MGAFDMTLVGIKALKEEDMSVDQMAVELKKKLRSKCRVAKCAEGSVPVRASEGCLPLERTCRLLLYMCHARFL